NAAGDSASATTHTTRTKHASRSKPCPPDERLPQPGAATNERSVRFVERRRPQAAGRAAGACRAGCGVTASDRSEGGAVGSFEELHADRIVGTLTMFDRMIFRGHLTRLFPPGAISAMLWQLGFPLSDFTRYATT